MLKFIVGFLLGCMVGCSSARADDCSPCMIVADIRATDNSIIEQKRYHGGRDIVPDSKSCEAEIAGEPFQLALRDIQDRADIIGPDHHVTAACHPLDYKPVHP